jgi:hypothetical protein
MRFDTLMRVCVVYWYSVYTDVVDLSIEALRV